MVGDKERPLGTFTKFPEDKAQSTNCVYDKKVYQTCVCLFVVVVLFFFSSFLCFVVVVFAFFKIA